MNYLYEAALEAGVPLLWGLSDVYRREDRRARGRLRMSESFDRGRNFENKVRKIMSQKLQLEIKRDKQSGAGIHKQDIRDRYNELPLFIECKDHETIKPKAWYREADAKSNYGQAAVVVFPDDEEVLCVMRFTDLLNLVREMMDWKQTADDLREPVDTTFVPKKSPLENLHELNESIEKKKAGGAKECRNGHISDEYGYCTQLDCKYSRGYRAPKVKKK